MREILVSVSICFICWLREKHRDRCLLSGTFTSEFVISLSIFLLTRECFIRETKYVIWLGEGTKFGDDINIHKKIYFFRSLWNISRQPKISLGFIRIELNSNSVLAFVIFDVFTIDEGYTAKYLSVDHLIENS